MECPNCKNGREFISEKNVLGWTQCCNCNYKANHIEFNVDIINNDQNTKITNSPLGLKISGKDDDCITIFKNKNGNLCIDGEMLYVNSIELNKVELEILIYKLTEIHKQIDN